MIDYKELKSIYYKDKDAYEEEYQRRFDSPESIRFSFDVNGNQAFLMETVAQWKIINEINKSNNEIIKTIYSSNRLPGKAVEQFKRKCLIDEVIISNQIEGVVSTRKDINSIIEKIDGTKRKKRLSSIVNKYNLLSTETDIKLNDSKDIRKLYDEIMLDEIERTNSSDIPDGRLFRKGSVSVAGQVAGTIIHEGLYPESKIIESMDHALDTLNNDDIDIFVRISIFHYMLGYIHPFYDGNGRLNRFISSYLLSKSSNELAGFVLSKSISENIDKYYKAFKKTNDERNKGDLTPFVLDFLEILKAAFEDLETELKYRLTEFNVYQIMLNGRVRNMEPKTKELYFILMQASLFAELGISMEELIEQFSVTRVTMANRLKSIDEEGLLEVRTSGHYKYYSLNLEVFRKMEEKT